MSALIAIGKAVGGPGSIGFFLAAGPCALWLSGLAIAGDDSRFGGSPRALAPSAIDTEPPSSGVRLLVPTYVALRVSRDAMYELAALRYYSSDASRIVR